MTPDSSPFIVPAPLVAICGWLVPGSGYFLIGQRGRAFLIGITILLLFVTGLLIAGVRVIEVPGFNVDTGEKQMVNIMTTRVDRMGNEISVPMPDPVTNQPMKRWSLEASFLGEIRDKPWSVPQVLTGPIAIIAGVCSLEAAKIDPATVKSPQEPGDDPKLVRRYGAITHARINEIGSLYLSVAGLLNLMAIIDCTWRASHLNEQRKEAQ